MRSVVVVPLLCAAWVSGCGGDDGEVADAGTDVGTDAGADASSPTADGCLPLDLYRDSDGDGFGDPEMPLRPCEARDGWVDNADDCDDSDATIHPGAVEVCDGVDQDCDSTADEDFECLAGSAVSCTTGCGTAGAGTCTAACEMPAAELCEPPEETCNYVDDDCDGVVDPGLLEPVLRETYPGAGATDFHVVSRDGGFVVGYVTAGAVLSIQRVDGSGAAEGEPLELGSNVWSFGMDARAGRLLVAWREDIGSYSEGNLRATVLDPSDLSTLVAPTTLRTDAGRGGGGDVEVAFATDDRAVIGYARSSVYAFGVDVADLGNASTPSNIGSVPSAWALGRGPGGNVLAVDSLYSALSLILVDADGARVREIERLSTGTDASGRVYVSPALHWDAEGGGAMAYAVLERYAPDPATDEVRLTLLDPAGDLADSVAVGGRAKLYLNTLERSVALTYAGGSWWVAYLGASDGATTTLSVRQVTSTGAGFEVTLHHVEGTCDGSGCTDTPDGNTQVSIAGGPGPVLVGASRTSAASRTVLIGCP